MSLLVECTSQLLYRLALNGRHAAGQPAEGHGQLPVLSIVAY